MELILGGVISGVIGALGSYVIIRKVAKSTINSLIDEYFDLEKLGKDEVFAKFIFGVGGLLAKGAKAGFGMDKKMKPQDIVQNMLIEWWQDRRKKNQEPRVANRDTPSEPTILTP